MAFASIFPEISGKEGEVLKRRERRNRVHDVRCATTALGNGRTNGRPITNVNAVLRHRSAAFAVRFGSPWEKCYYVPFRRNGKDHHLPGGKHRSGTGLDF